MSRHAEMRKRNYFKYCQAILIFGKKVMVNLLDWFYMGGDTNYLDYMLNEYHIFAMEDYLDVPRRYDLKYKTPMEFDLKVLYFLIRLACRLYDGKPKDKKNDATYQTIERGIDSIMLQCASLTQLKPSLNHEELEHRLWELKKLYESLITKGGELAGVSQFEIKQLHEKSSIGVMCLNSYLTKYNPEFDLNELEPFSERAFLNLMQQAERVVALEETVTVNDIAGFFKDISDDKMFCRLTRKHGPLDEEYEENARVFLKELQDYKQSLDEKEALKAENKIKGLGNKTTVKRKAIKNPVLTARPDSQGTSSSLDSESIKEDNKESSTSSKNSSEEISRDTLKLIAMQYKVKVTVHPIKTNTKPLLQGSKPALVCTDNDFLLKEHKKYSRRPGRQVKLRNLFAVEGLNDEVAKIIIISGEAGMSKTFLSKYIVDTWNDEPSAFDGLPSAGFIFFTELKENRYSTVYELVSQELQSPYDRRVINSELLNLEVISKPILLALDGYDDSCDKSCQLVREVLQTEIGDQKVLVTCRPQYVETIYQQIPKTNRKYVSHVTLNGIPQVHHADCVRRLIDFNLPTERKVNTIHVEKIKDGLISFLPNIYSILGDELCNPHVLSIIVEMWLEMPHSM